MIGILELSRKELSSEFINSVYMGSFNPELFWNYLNNLKASPDGNLPLNNIVDVMDEMQFVFCRDRDDVLITSKRMDQSFCNYLSNIGFEFENLLIDEFLSDDGRREKDLFLVPYAVTAKVLNIADQFLFLNKLPDLQIVKKVNSKIYSNEIISKIDEQLNRGIVIYNSSDLLATGIKFLSSSVAIVLKEEFGVSGRGNRLITSKKKLKKIVELLKKQEEAGESVRLVLEPYYNKELDFSSHYQIHDGGNIEFLGIRMLKNKNFSFNAVASPDLNLFKALENSNIDYLQITKQVVERVRNEGYLGFVNIDSMLLRNGKIIPVVEINARKSMGLISHQIDNYLEKIAKISEKVTRKSELTSINLNLFRRIDFEELLKLMEKENILFARDSSSGIIPLSSATININFEVNQDRLPVKGKFYYAVVTSLPEEKESYEEKLKMILNNLSSS